MLRLENSRIEDSHGLVNIDDHKFGATYKINGPYIWRRKIARKICCSVVFLTRVFSFAIILKNVTWEKQKTINRVDNVQNL